MGKNDDAEKAKLFQKIIAEEVMNFIAENKKAIVKRAEKRLRKILAHPA